MRQRPEPLKVTAPPATEQTPDPDVASMENSTGLPEPPPLAAGVYDVPGRPGWGGLDVKLMACDCGRTVTVNLVTTDEGESSLSLAVHVTVLVPTGKMEPDAVSQLTVRVSVPSSVAVGWL
jgi:hypothetical protein